MIKKITNHKAWLAVPLLGLGMTNSASAAIDLSTITDAISGEVAAVIAAALLIIGACALIPVSIKAAKMIIAVGSSMFSKR